MDDIDPDQLKIMEALEPYLGRMFPLFDQAVSLYNQEVSAAARAEHDDRATASAVWCHIWHGFQREFAADAGFHFMEVRGLHILNIQDQIVLRAKKVDANGRHRNNDTEQQRAFDAQDPLPGLPPQADRIIMGYQPDPAFSCVERVLVRRPLGGWVSQIAEPGGDRAWIDITPVELPLGRVRRAAGE